MPLRFFFILCDMVSTGYHKLCYFNYACAHIIIGMVICQLYRYYYYKVKSMPLFTTRIRLLIKLIGLPLGKSNAVFYIVREFAVKKSWLHNAKYYAIMRVYRRFAAGFHLRSWKFMQDYVLLRLCNDAIVPTHNHVRHIRHYVGPIGLHASNVRERKLKIFVKYRFLFIVKLTA